MTFGRNRTYDFKYYLLGDTRSHRDMFRKHMGRGFTEPPPQGFSANHLSKEVWNILNNENRLALPPSCNKCGPEEQQVFWRTFTRTSLDAFKANEGRGREIEESRIMEANGNKVINNEELERSGFIWISQNPKFALSVGLARGLSSDEQISLMGINICKCCLEKGIKMTDVLGISKNQSHLREVTAENIKRKAGFSQGIIINQIPLDKLNESVWFDVNLNPFSKIKKALLKSGLEVGTSTSSSFLKTLSGMIGELLMFLALKDPEEKNGIDFQTLPRTFKIFLSPLIQDEATQKIL
jgi:hypothetical protein